MHKVLQAGFRFQGFVQGDIQLIGDKLCDTVHLGVRHFQHPSDIANGRFRLHRTEGNDLTDIVLAVLLHDVIDHFLTAVHAEVHIDVWQRDAFRIQEALEQEAIDQGVEVGDTQRIRDEAAGGGSASGTHRDAAASGEVDDIPDDQKVAGKSHGCNDRQFIAKPLLVSDFGNRGGSLPQPGSQALAGERVKIGFQRVSVGNAVLWKVRLPEGERQLAHFRHMAGVPDRLGPFVKRGEHLVGGFDIELIGMKPHAVRLIHRLAGLKAQQNVVDFGIVFLEVMAVVRGYQRNAELPMYLSQTLIRDLLLGNRVFLNLQKVVLLPEELAIFCCRSNGIR